MKTRNETMKKFFYAMDTFFAEKISRRKFLKVLFGGFVYFVSQNILLKLAFAQTPPADGRKKKGVKGNYDLVVAEGSDAYAATVKTIEEMGGMGRFVKKGAVVFMKPNISWDRTPEQAANTNPLVVAALIDLCFKAGAKRVNIADNSCNEARRCYAASGIQKVAKEHGANIYFFDEWDVVKAHFSYKSPMEGWPIFRSAVECETFIDVPVLKHHNLTGLTIGMKNLMGVCSGRRGLIHVNIGRKLADLTDFISPDLTVVDATKVLVRHGPSGGSLSDVVVMDKVITAADPVLADSYASTLMDRDPMSIGNIRNAVEFKYGSADIAEANIRKVKV